MSVKLHLGCGKKKLEGYVNIDISSEVGPDLVADICSLPYENDSVDEILCVHTIEHVTSFYDAMKEIHRVLKKGAIARITVPCATCNSAYHPYHLWYFSYQSFLPFEENNDLERYYDFHFSKVNVTYWFAFFTRWITPFANRFFWMYENTLFSSIFPARELYVELIK